MFQSTLINIQLFHVRYIHKSCYYLSRAQTLSITSNLISKDTLRSNGAAQVRGNTLTSHLAAFAAS